MIGWVVAAASFATLMLPAAAQAADEAHDVVTRSAEASLSTPFDGEALWITFADDRSYVTTVDVIATGDGEVAVRASEAGKLKVAGGAATFPQGVGGWALALADRTEAERLDRLADNYRVEVEGDDQVLTRPSTVVVFERRADGVVRERLWVDDEVGLPLRRETYDPAGEVVRLATFLSLDLDPEPVDDTWVEGLEERLADVTPVDDEGLAALRKADWVVPEALPRGYEALAAFAMATDGAPSLQVVYGDGLYTVSVFQQKGSADWDSLPPGAETVEQLPGTVYEWPGALPQRLVWSVDGRTWALVGDAPPDDLRAIADALPMADDHGVLQRLARGFGRLWSGVSEWGRSLWD